jgi:succinate dehydrogenase / fumarate reductase flavoprotein subunit
MISPNEPQTRPHDVLVIGAGGAGLRAAIAAQEAGADVGLVCKSLLGKAHTVMAEGGVAAALAHVAPNDDWKVHFRDTMVGGKYLNNPRMAQLHALEAPDRVRELEAWGAVFDRTRDGRILQRPFGGHSHPRLAHVGDRTGLEMIRTLQDRAVASGIQVYMECTITRLTTSRSGVTGAVGYWRTTGRPIVFPAKAVVLATGGIGRAYSVTSNSWEYSGDGHALAYEAGAELIDMEFVQFHPTGMVWPPGVRGLLVTEAVRGEGGILRNASGERFMWKYLPEEGAVRGPPDRREAPTRAVDPRQRVAGDLHRGARGSRITARGCLPRHQLPPGRPRQAQAPVDVRAVQGACRRRHHDGADGGGTHDPLRDGRGQGRRRDGRDPCAWAVRLG